MNEPQPGWLDDEIGKILGYYYLSFQGGSLPHIRHCCDPYGNVIGGRMPRFSSSHERAFEVVDHMRKTKNNWFVLNRYGDDERWFAGFGDGSTQFPGEAMNAPHAICLAALAATHK